MENQADRMLIGRLGNAQKSHWKVEAVKFSRNRTKSLAELYGRATKRDNPAFDCKNSAAEKEALNYR
ncbi:hypothetical protein AMECASPLE_008577 [Ameca splendens]|uniref:Uncharacterized protein n=1 Tax=Ameca splendens TaxID=208324 RepID=A0ABV0ZYV4_9TELE